VAGNLSAGVYPADASRLERTYAELAAGDNTRWPEAVRVWPSRGQPSSGWLVQGGLLLIVDDPPRTPYDKLCTHMIEDHGAGSTPCDPDELEREHEEAHGVRRRT
jgi:hypothetical protein